MHYSIPARETLPSSRSSHVPEASRLSVSSRASDHQIQNHYTPDYSQSFLRNLFEDVILTVFSGHRPGYLPVVNHSWVLVAAGFFSEGNIIPPHSHYRIIRQSAPVVTLHTLLEQLGDHPYTPHLEDVMYAHSPWQIWTGREFIPITAKSEHWLHLGVLGARQLTMPNMLYLPLAAAQLGTHGYDHAKSNAFGFDVCGSDLPHDTPLFVVYFIHAEVSLSSFLCIHTL